MELKICLLQVPRIWLDGKEVSFPLRRADALLFYLVCTKTATREEVVSLLWDKLDVETGRRNLRNLLYVIRKHLGIPMVITTQKNKLSLDPELKIDCDYLRFMEQGDYMAIHGPFLNGFGIKDSCAFDEWVDQTRERVHKQYLACLAAQIGSTVQTGTVGRAERCALEYLQSNPADEEMARFLISLYRAQSRFFDGIQIYQRLKEYLSQEMGITPLSETTQLYQEVLREWNLAVCEQEEESEEQYLSSDRQRLMRRVNGLLFPRALRDGYGGGAVLLQGSAGVGKTFLTEQYLKNLDEHVCVLSGTCFSSGQEERLGPWQAVAIQLKQIVDAAPEQYPGKAAQAARQLAAQPLRTCALDQAEELFFHLLVSLLEQGRVLLCLENVQWADEESLFLLGRLLRKFYHAALSCLLTGRDALPPRVKAAIRQLEEAGLLHCCLVHPFSPEEVREFLQLELGGGAAELGEQLWNTTRGNPFLLRKLIHPPGKEASDPGHLLQQEKQLSLYWLELLSGEGRRLMDLAAFFPEGASEEVLFRLLGAPRDAFALALEETLGTGLLREEEAGGRVLSWGDEGLRQQIYQAKSGMARRDTHRRIAQMLQFEREDPKNFGQAEYHFRMAGDWSGVLRVQDMACERFLKSFPGRGTDEYFRELYQRVGALSGDCAPPAEGEGRWRELLLALSALFSGQEQAAFPRLELVLEQGGGARPSLLHAALSLISQWAWQEDRARQLTEGLEALEPPTARLLRGELLSVGGIGELSGTVLTPLLDDRDPLVRCYACYLLGLNDQRRGEAEAEQWYDKAAAQAAAMPAFWGMAQICRDAGRRAWAEHREMRARALFESALHFAAETEDGRTLSMVQAYLSALTASSGEDTVAVRFLREAQAAAKELSPLEQGAVCLAKAWILCTGERRGTPGPRWGDLITEDALFYARRGLMLLYPLKDVEAERSLLLECLQLVRNRNGKN